VGAVKPEETQRAELGGAGVLQGPRCGRQRLSEVLCAAGWLRDAEKRPWVMEVTGRMAGARAGGWGRQVRWGLRAGVPVPFGVAAGEQVGCEGTGLAEGWGELKGGCGAWAGVGREGGWRGAAQPGELGSPWQQLWCEPLRRREAEGARFGRGWGNEALSV